MTRLLMAPTKALASPSRHNRTPNLGVASHLCPLVKIGMMTLDQKNNEGFVRETALC